MSGTAGTAQTIDVARRYELHSPDGSVADVVLRGYGCESVDDGASYRVSHTVTGRGPQYVSPRCV